MKLITFMEMCVVFDWEGYKITGNGEVAVIFGQLGKLVIPYGDIYTIKAGDLRRRVHALKYYPELRGNHGNRVREFRGAIRKGARTCPLCKGSIAQIDADRGEPIEGGARQLPICE